jgi:hypothetical protein
MQDFTFYADSWKIANEKFAAGEITERERDARRAHYLDAVNRCQSSTLTGDVVTNAIFRNGFDAALDKAVRGIALFDDHKLDYRVRLVAKNFATSETLVMALVIAEKSKSLVVKSDGRIVRETVQFDADAYAAEFGPRS